MAAVRLRAAGIDGARLEARLLLAHALGVSPADLLRNRDAEVDGSALAPLLGRRLAHEPLALILGVREFWSLSFAVSPATLIPRPESETLIEVAVAAFAERPAPGRILDLGVGTGCLLLAALAEFPAAFGIGVDRSAEAAAVARSNAVALGLANRAAFLCGDWAGPLAGRFDLVLCNPPYIPTSALDGLMPEVARFEPRTALDGGSDGLVVYRDLLPDIPRLLRPNGIAVLELGQGQAAPVGDLARRAGMVMEIRNDLSGIERAMLLRGAVP
jgi:release factor glutamine methyltransferase